MSIVILASVGCQNLGDELILKNTVAHYKKRFSKELPEFHVFSYDPLNPFFTGPDVHYHEYFPIWLRKLWGITKNIKNYNLFINTVKASDLVIIGWWGLFFDSEWTVSTMKNLKLWLFRTKAIAKYNKTLIFHWVWINFTDKNKKSYKDKIKAIFEHASEIYVRDSFSQKYLRKLWIDSEIILDPVYNDRKKYKDHKKKELLSLKIQDFSVNLLHDIDFKNKTIGLALRKLTHKWYNAKVIELIEYLIQRKANIVLLPHSFHKFDSESNDLTFFMNLLSEHYSDNEDFLEHHNISLTHSMEETYSYYTKKKLDIIFASRLHSLILARSYKIPYIALSYSRKTDEQL
jgi:polysaccharide pyruvyl transferase WcaK-like protein